MSGRCSATAATQRGGVADRGHHLVAEPLEQPDQALAQQHPVLGEHQRVSRPHGSSTRSRVGPPGGLDSSSRAVARGDPVGQPGQAGAGGRVGAAAPSSRTSSTSRSPCSRAVTRAGLAPLCLATLASASHDHVVRGRPRPAPAAGRGRSMSTSTGTGERPARSRTAAGRPRSVSTCGCTPADQLAQLGQRLLGLLVRVAPPARRAGDPGGRSSRARPSFMVSATSRCWAPSCRSRSMRRRSTLERVDQPGPGPRHLDQLRVQLVARGEHGPGQRGPGARPGGDRVRGERQQQQRRRREQRSDRRPAACRSAAAAPAISSDRAAQRRRHQAEVDPPQRDQRRPPCSRARARWPARAAGSASQAREPRRRAPVRVAAGPRSTSRSRHRSNRATASPAGDGQERDQRRPRSAATRHRRSKQGRPATHAGRRAPSTTPAAGRPATATATTRQEPQRPLRERLPGRSGRSRADATARPAPAR